MYDSKNVYYQIQLLKTNIKDSQINPENEILKKCIITNIENIKNEIELMLNYIYNLENYIYNLEKLQTRPEYFNTGI